MDSQWDSSWPLKQRKQLTHDDYTVAWLCALPIEIEAAENVLDEAHIAPPHLDTDNNIYIFGKICGHNVVIGWPDIIGATATARLATHMTHTFRSLRFGLLVGIAAGVPENGDVRLGDVVVSKRDGISGGFGVHDHGKNTSDGFIYHPYLNGVPEMIGKAIQRLASRPHKIKKSLDAFCCRNPDFSTFQQPTGLADDLFEREYTHVNSLDKGCLECDKSRVVKRIERLGKDPQMHFGTVASGNQVVKTAVKRAEIAGSNPGYLAIEMEAAGLVDVFGCATVRGICDYADSHKNDGWHKYAAAVAAALAREILDIVPVLPRFAVQSVVVDSSSAGNEHWLVPRQPNPYFTGREEILKVLKEQLCSPSSTMDISKSQRRFVIYGLGGSGKSEVCIKFAEENREIFWGIFWIDCSSVKTIKESFANVSRRCDVGEDFEQAKIWLQNLEKPWLLILDNADDPDLDYNKYIPSGNRGCILMSTRNPRYQEFSTTGAEVFDKLDFQKLNYEEAVTLLLKSSKVTIEDPFGKCRGEAEEVVRILEQHALAIVNAGAYIRERHCTLKEYPSEFARQRTMMLRHHPKQASSIYGGVYATFAASTEVIATRAQDDADYHNALELFDVLAYMHFNDVNPEIWERAFKTSDERFLDDLSDDINYMSNWHKSMLPKFLESNENMSWKLLLRKAINVLSSFSLVNEQNSGILNMHPLAHAWARDRPVPKDQIRAWIRSGVVLSFATGAGSYNIFFRQLRQHIVSCMQDFPSAVWSAHPPLEVARTIYWLGYVLYWEKEVETAIKMYKTIKEHLKPVEGSLSWFRLENHIANFLAERGDFELELSLLQQMQPFTSYIIDNYLRWDVQSSLAVSYWRLKRYEKAMTLSKKIFFETREKLESTDMILLSTLYDLALIYTDMGKNRKALKILEGVVSQQTTVLDRTHPDLLASRHSLGTCYLDYGLPQKAIEILEDVVEIRAEVLRPTDEESLRLTSQHALARAYGDCGAYDKAIELMKKVVCIQSRILDPKNSSRRVSEYQLARFYIETDLFGKAIEILEEVVRIEEQVLDFSDVDLLDSKILLGTAYLGIEKCIESVAILKDVFEVEMRTYHTTDRSCLWTRWFLTIAYLKLPRRGDALKLLEEVVPGLTEREEPTSPLRQDFERLLERCQDHSYDPFSDEFQKIRDWMKPEIIDPEDFNLDDVSDISSLSSDDESEVESEVENESREGAEQTDGNETLGEELLDEDVIRYEADETHDNESEGKGDAIAESGGEMGQANEDGPRIVEIEDMVLSLRPTQKSRWWRKSRSRMGGRGAEEDPGTSKQDSPGSRRTLGKFFPKNRK